MCASCGLRSSGPARLRKRDVAWSAVGIVAFAYAAFLFVDSVAAILSSDHRAPPWTSLPVLATVLAFAVALVSKDRGAMFFGVPILGAVLLVPTCGPARVAHELAQVPAHATGTVTGGSVKTTFKRSGSESESAVQYSFTTAGGQVVTGSGTVDEALKLGSEVSVRYDPASPERNLISSSGPFWVILWALGALLALGAVCFGTERAGWRTSLLAVRLLFSSFLLTCFVLGIAGGRSVFEGKLGSAHSTAPEVPR